MTRFLIGVARGALVPVLVLGFLVAVWGYRDSVQSILALPEAAHEAFQKTVLTLIWFSAGFLFKRLLDLLFWNGIVRRTLGRHPPRLVVQLTGVIVLLVTISGILRFVYDQPVTALWAASGAVGLVIGFALQNLILDTFSGLAIHLERPFKVGDWINCHSRMGNFIGRVEETNWRTTRLWTVENNIIIIPNSYITTTILSNFAMPDSTARFEMEFFLDFSVPVDRAIRILSAAIVSTIGRGPLASPPPKVRTDGITERGVCYKITYFLLATQTTPNKAADIVTRAVAKHIKEAGLIIPHARQDVFVAKMPWRTKTWSYLKDQVWHLHGLAIFQGLKDEDLEFIAKNMTVNSVDKGEIIVKQGDEGSSMFVLAEGLLDVIIEKPDGSEIKVANLVPGNFFGEKSLLTGDPRSATIKSAAESVICEITKPCMAELLERNTDLAETLARVIVERDMHNQKVFSNMSRAQMESEMTSVVGKFLGKMSQFFGRG